MIRFILLLALGILAVGCQSSSLRSTLKTPPPAEWLAWQVKRTESIGGSNGWTTLIARQWLNEGRNSVGSNPTNDAVIASEHVPAHLGIFTRTGRAVHFDAAPGIVATIGGQPVQAADLASDATGSPTKLIIDGISVVVIERGERIGLRMRDPMAPTRLHFGGLKCFPYDPTWRIAGRFEPFTTARTLRVADIIGGTQEYRSTGALTFSRGGRESRLDVAEESEAEDFFIIFRDETAGDSTYAAGRFLAVSRPDAAGNVIIDFNYAYTPPCGFTPFATCPLPPRQNWLPLAIRAGERKPH